MSTDSEKVEKLHAELVEMFKRVGENVARAEAFREIINRAIMPVGAIVQGWREDAEDALAKTREILTELDGLDSVEPFGAETIDAAVARAIED